MKNCLKAAKPSAESLVLPGFGQTIFLVGVYFPPKQMLNKKQKIKICTKVQQSFSSWWGGKLRLQPLSKSRVRACIQRPRIGDGWAIYNFLPERLPSKRTKS